MNQFILSRILLRFLTQYLTYCELFNAHHAADVARCARAAGSNMATAKVFPVGALKVLNGRAEHL